MDTLVSTRTMLKAAADCCCCCYCPRRSFCTQKLPLFTIQSNKGKLIWALNGAPYSHTFYNQYGERLRGVCVCSACVYLYLYMYTHVHVCDIVLFVTSQLSSAIGIGKWCSNWKRRKSKHIMSCHQKREREREALPELCCAVKFPHLYVHVPLQS